MGVPVCQQAFRSPHFLTWVLSEAFSSSASVQHWIHWNRRASMQFDSEVLQFTYYLGTYPARWAISRHLMRSSRYPLMILFYHRVADWPLNPWTISRRLFRRQIDWLARHFDLVTLDVLLDLMAQGANNRPRLHITFDDGYRDNCQFALPLLHERRIPYTYFVASAHVIHHRPFPHDVQRGEPLAPNTVDDLQWIADHGGTIGSHTRDHVDCGPVADDELLIEQLVGSKRDLEQLIGRQVEYFAFPYGQPWNLSRQAMSVAAVAGYRAVCSAYGGYNLPGSGDAHLRRIHGDTNFARLKSWLTLDPRKVLRRRPCLTYRPRRAALQEVGA